MFKIKKLTNRGNPDFGQDPGRMIWDTYELEDVEASKLKDLQRIVGNYIYENELGGGSFCFPTVYKNAKPVGYFSYNLKFWKTNNIPGHCT